MKTLYYKNLKNCYITAATAHAMDMQGVEIHHFLDVEDLINNNGIPDPSVVEDESIFYLDNRGTLYKLASPRNFNANKYALQSWAGKIAILDDNGKGVLDIKNNKVIIPCDSDNKEIYPISDNYFVVISNKKKTVKTIVNRQNIVIDELNGNYVLKDREDAEGKELLRHVILPNGTKNIERRWTLNALKRAESAIGLDNELIELINKYKDLGYGFPLIYDKVKKCYFNDKDDVLIH